MPEERFRAYWRDVHGPLCSRVPALDWYVQHHFVRHQDIPLWPMPDGAGALPGYSVSADVARNPTWRVAETQDCHAPGSLHQLGGGH